MLKSVDSHKHLGLTISSNLTSQMDCILNSVTSMCDAFMKKLKYDVDRLSLERTYFNSSDQSLNMHHIIGKIIANEIQINLNTFNVQLLK